MILLKGLFKRYCYTGIDTMPVYNWMQLNENFDIKFILKKPLWINKINKLSLALIWKDVYYQYIDKFGFTDEFIYLLEKKREIALKKIDLIVTGDKSINTLIKIDEIELEKMLEGSKGKTSFMEIKIHIEKFFGFHLDLKNVTVSEFYSYLEVIRKHGRQSNKT